MPKIRGASSAKLNVDVSFIKRLRETLGYDQKKFADVIKTDRSNYAKKEKGIVPITLQEWILLASYINKYHHVVFNISGSYDPATINFPVITPEAIQKFPVLEKIIHTANEAIGNNDVELLIKIMEYAIEKLKLPPANKTTKFSRKPVCSN